MKRELASAAERRVDLEGLRQRSLEMYMLERTFSYTAFQRSAESCAHALEESGAADVRTWDLPADGRTTHMDFVMPRAWDAHDARLEICEPEVAAGTIARHVDQPMCLANRSAATPPGGATYELVSEAEMARREALEGALVFTRRGEPSRVRRAVLAKGGAGIVSSFSNAYLDRPDSTYWINGWGGFPGWYHTAEDTHLIGFSIPPREGERLDALLRAGPVRVRADVQSVIYDGSIRSVTGRLPAAEHEGPHDGEILLLAHIYEPMVNDNATGAAALPEIARLVRQLQHEGMLGPLRRPLRFLISMERYGFAEYFEHAEHRERALCGVNLDSISLDPGQSGGQVKLLTSPASLPFVGDALLRDLVGTRFADQRPGIATGRLGDDTFISDRTIGVPCAQVMSTPGMLHHSGADSFERATDWDLTRRIVATIASYAATLATAGTETAGALASLVPRQARTDMDRVLAEAPDDGRAAGQLELLQHMHDGRIESARRLAPDIEIDQPRQQVAQAFRARWEELEDPVEGRQSYRKERMRRVDRNMIVRRKALGIPFCLARVPAKRRQPHPPHVHQLLNWADGERDLAELLDWTAAETGHEWTEAEARRVREYIRLLADHGDLEISHRVVVRRADILETLRGLGVDAGDRIVVHSALSALGHVEGGPDMVCRALMELVTEQGLLLMPSFNHGAPFEAAGPGVYDPGQTPTKNGAVADAFWRMHGVHRSLNPTHPFAAWGRDARKYVEDHHKRLTMGEGSPLHMLEQEGGRAVMIDCLPANTFHHVVEMTNRTPCLGQRTETYPVRLPDGRIVHCRTWGWRNQGCPLSEGGVYREEMRRLGLIREAPLGLGTVYVFSLRDCRQVWERLYREGGPIAPRCDGACGTRVGPRQVEATVESDWDNGAGRVRSDSPAFVGDVKTLTVQGEGERAD